MHVFKPLWVSLFILLFSSSVPAQTIADIDIADTISLSPKSNKLILNGAGIRSKFIFDIYIGALYLETKYTNADDIYKAPGAKSISMHFLYDEVSKEKLVAGWNDGFENNHSSDELKKLNDRITQFNDLFITVKKGDTINLNYIPDSGTNIIINGANRGQVKGEDFFVALLKIWLGHAPADSDLKAAMLGAIN